MSVDARIYDAYLACALREDLVDESGKRVEGHSIFDFDKEARDTTREELEDFVAKADGLLEGLEPAEIGRQFWLARNGRIPQSWDALGERGAKLTAIANSYDSVDLSIGGNGKISISVRHRDFGMSRS